MAIWQYDLSLVPTVVMSRDEVMSELSSLLLKTNSWSDLILIWGEMEGNRVSLFDDETPPELSVRVDLRTDSSQFVRDLVSFAKKMCYQIVNSDNKEIQPTMKDIAADIAKSDAFRFMKCPEQFLESLEM